MVKLLLIVLLFVSCTNYEDKKQYCGEVVEKGYEHPTSGYKSNRDPTYFILLRVESGKVIRVNVTVPTYYSLSKGQRTCFTLTRLDMIRYGNGDHIN